MTIAPARPEVSELEARALFEEARRRRRRRRRRIYLAMAVVTIAAAAVTAVVAGTALTRNSLPPAPDHPMPRAGGPVGAQAMPSQMVVWAQNGRSTMSVQVINSHTGQVERTLANDIGLFRMGPEPSAAPDGTVYYDQGVTQGPNARPPVEEIVSLPITGGTPRFVAVGHDPTVSPNGRYLAYLTWTDLTNDPEGVVVMDRQTGAETTWQYSTNKPDINGLSWAPDSKSFVVSADTLTGNAPHDVIGRVWLSDPTSRSLNSLTQLPLPLCPPPTQWAGSGANREMAWGGFLDAHEGIGICHTVELSAQDSRSQAVVFDLASGRTVRKLPAVPGLISGFQSDPSGHHLVFIGGGLGAGGLFRWTVDAVVHQAKPVLVKERVGSVSWVPANQ